MPVSIWKQVVVADGDITGQDVQPHSQVSLFIGDEVTNNACCWHNRGCEHQLVLRIRTVGEQLPGRGLGFARAVTGEILSGPDGIVLNQFTGLVYGNGNQHIEVVVSERVPLRSYIPSRTQLWNLIRMFAPNQPDPTLERADYHVPPADRQAA